MQSCKFNVHCKLQEYPSPDDGSGPKCGAIGTKCDKLKGCPYKLDADLYIV